MENFVLDARCESLMKGRTPDDPIVRARECPEAVLVSRFVQLSVLEQENRVSSAAGK